MACLIATEGTLFAVLIASFFYLRFKSAQWPPPGTEQPKLTIPLVLMAVLVSTSVPMQLAASAASRGRLAATRAWLLVALFLGSGYLAEQLYRLVVSLRTLHPSESSYASIVYVLVGGHHAHVALALCLDLFLLVRLSRGLTSYRLVAVQSVALYWHFVNALALVVTGTLLSAAA
jgi:heme/copper-type cytochrome/quinol oxidase subunit 3